MAPVKVYCRDCGDIFLEPSDVEVLVIPGGEHNRYMFTCPQCNAKENRLVLASTTDLLIALGVRKTGDKPPAEFNETKHGVPLADSDLPAFCSSLDNDEELAAAIRSLTGPA